ncbi:hypothetical protein CRENBAI_013270 [Crenichthys baileyi]|uniref:Uncharacterized protein n=1 Tax=Crenichthys baileyi TaxID=28760 RepID=A0AAV9RJP2_9TELE
MKQRSPGRDYMGRSLYRYATLYTPDLHFQPELKSEPLDLQTRVVVMRARSFVLTTEDQDGQMATCCTLYRKPRQGVSFSVARLKLTVEVQIPVMDVVEIIVQGKSSVN